MIYSAPWDLGSWGLGNLMLQQCLALYDAGLLEKIYCRRNVQTIIPKRYILEIPIDNDIEFDEAAARQLRYDVAKNQRVSYMGSRSLHQQNLLRTTEGWNGKILKYCGSTYPTVQNSIVEYENTIQSRVGIKVKPTNHAVLRYGILECEGADAYSCASELVKRSFLASGFNEDYLSVLPLGVDTDVFFKEPSPVLTKSEKGEFNIGFTATNPIRKGLIYLYNEFLKLDVPGKQLHLRTNVNIDHPRVLNYPYLDTMKALYSDIHVFVLPSAEDGFAMTALEAMACGIPVMTTSTTGASELITHGVDGFIYDTPQQCAAAIHDIYKIRDQLPEIGECARKTAEKYTWESYREKFTKWVKLHINN